MDPISYDAWLKGETHTFTTPATEETIFGREGGAQKWMYTTMSAPGIEQFIVKPSDSFIKYYTSTLTPEQTDELERQALREELRRQQNL